MGHIEVLLYPLLVDLVASAIACQRVHVSRLLLKALQGRITILNEEVLIVDMVAGKEQAYRRGKAQATVTAIRG